MPALTSPQAAAFRRLERDLVRRRLMQLDPRMRIEIEVTARRAMRPPSSAAAQRRRVAKPKARKKAAKRAGKKGRR